MKTISPLRPVTQFHSPPQFRTPLFSHPQICPNPNRNKTPDAITVYPKIRSKETLFRARAAARPTTKKDDEIAIKTS